MIQKEWFSKISTDHLLSMRYKTTCYYPKNEEDKPDYINDRGIMYQIDKGLLYDELSKRPHRIRAKDRRKIE